MIEFSKERKSERINEKSVAPLEFDTLPYKEGTAVGQW